MCDKAGFDSSNEIISMYELLSVSLITKSEIWTQLMTEAKQPVSHQISNNIVIS